MPKKAKDKKGKKGKKGKNDKKSNTDGESLAKRKSLPKLPPIIPIVCQSSNYPGYLNEPAKIAVMCVPTGTYDELCDAVSTGFTQAGRIMLITPWGNYAIFREFNGEENIYFLYDGCTCLLNVFRYYDLKRGTAGLLYFQSTHEILNYILENRFKREKYKRLNKTGAIERLCTNYCTRGGANLFKICNRRGELCNMDEYIIKELMFPRCKERCDANSVKSIEREMPTYMNQKLFKRVLEGRKKSEKIKCK